MHFVKPERQFEQKETKDFGEQFCKQFCDFCEKCTCLTLFVVFIFCISLISVQIRLSAHYEQALTQKLLFLNARPGCIIGYLQ